MLNATTSLNQLIIRVIAVIALVVFSVQISSSLIVANDTQIEIVEFDFDDDGERDMENEAVDLIYNSTLIEFREEQTVASFTLCNRWYHQHLEELSCPPPEEA